MTDNFSEANYRDCIQLRKPELWIKSTRERVTCTALPLTSAPMDAAVAIVLGTVAVLVSQMCIYDMGIFNSRLATCGKRHIFKASEDIYEDLSRYFSE